MNEKKLKNVCSSLYFTRLFEERREINIDWPSQAIVEKKTKSLNENTMKGFERRRGVMTLWGF